jgi:hypothetical protein
MKRELTNCKQGRKRNFRFASILCGFLFERVPGLGPRVDIVLHGLHDPAMAWWTEVMRQLRGGRVPIPYNDDFFFCWCQQVIDMDEYPYAWIDFIGYLGHAITARFFLWRHRYEKVFLIFHFFVFL